MRYFLSKFRGSKHTPGCKNLSKTPTTQRYDIFSIVGAVVTRRAQDIYIDILRFVRTRRERESISCYGARQHAYVRWNAQAGACVRAVRCGGNEMTPPDAPNSRRRWCHPRI